MKKKYIISLLILSGIIVGEIVIKHNHNNLLLNKINPTIYSTYTYLLPSILENVEDIITFVELEKEYTPEYMLELSDAVVIASVISIDGADTKYNQAVGYTYGKIVINNSIYGNINQGSIINYMKSGGIMTLEEYDKYQIEEIQEKHKNLREQSGIDASQIYVNTHFENDINVETGKTYLCYLKYIDSIGKYEIIGLGNGLRELNLKKKEFVSSLEINIYEQKILNNNTGEYESLNDYIKKYINI